MNGYITFWSKDYVKQLNKNEDKGSFKVVYGSQHTKMPQISSVCVGDIIYAVSLQQGTLCIMARLQVERIEPAFDYLMRETGKRHAALIPADVHTTINEDELEDIPHLFHEEPITCCANLAASGTNGSIIVPRPIPLEVIPTLMFGKTKSNQKPLRLDKNGCPTSISLSGFVRKMSDNTFEIFERIFRDAEEKE